MPDRIIRQLDGKRGGFLLITGIVWLAFGIGYVLEPGTQSRIKGFAWLPTWLNADELGWIWVIAGLIALTASVSGHQRPRWENAGFGALIVPPVLWVFVFGWATWLGEHPTGWISALIYAAFATIIWHCSSWPNPIKRSPAREAALLADRNVPVRPEHDELEGGGDQS